MKTQERTKIKPNLFNDFPFSPTNRQLFINRSKFLCQIQQMKQQTTLMSLRNSVVHLEINLRNVKTDKIGILNIDSNGDTIEICQKYLFDQLDQISESQTLERAKYYVDRLEKALTQVRTNKINDINLNRWKEYSNVITDSLWILEKRDSSGVHKADYWGNFIPQIVYHIMSIYTEKDKRENYESSCFYN